VNPELIIPLLTFGGTLLLVVTGLLNFSVFLRQLRAARDQLETARRQLESARQQPQIQLVQRAMAETSDHLKILIEKPYLRPYFYDNKAWAEGDVASLNEVKAMAELILNNFASAIIHSAVFPEYPVRGVEETIRFHLRHSPAMRDFLMEGFDRFQLAGLALVCLKNETKTDAERDLRDLSPFPARMWLRRRVAKGYCATWSLRTKGRRWNWQSTVWSEQERLRWMLT
jgi:hypothetical protein